jgi:hypothetical protein
VLSLQLSPPPPPPPPLLLLQSLPPPPPPPPLLDLGFVDLEFVDHALFPIDTAYQFRGLTPTPSTRGLATGYESRTTLRA